MSVLEEIKDNGKCKRCDGVGKLPEYSHIHNGVCFGCWGTGYKLDVSESEYKVKVGEYFGLNGVAFKVVDIIWRNKYGQSQFFPDMQDIIGNQALKLVSTKNGKTYYFPILRLDAEGLCKPAPEELIGKSV